MSEAVGLQRNKTRRAGFTLLEMVITAGILGVTAALTSGGFSSAAGRRAADYDVDFLTSEMRNMRAEAMRSGKTVRMTPSLAPGGNADQRLYLLKTEADPAATRASCSAQVFGTELSRKTWKPKSLYRFYALAPAGLCYFPDGSSTGGVLYLTERDAAPPESAQGTKTAGGQESTVLRFTAEAPEAAGPRAYVEIPAGTGLPDVTKDFAGAIEAAARQEE